MSYQLISEYLETYTVWNIVRFGVLRVLGLVGLTGVFGFGLTTSLMANFVQNDSVLKFDTVQDSFLYI